MTGTQPNQREYWNQIKVGTLFPTRTNEDEPVLPLIYVQIEKDIVHLVEEDSPETINVFRGKIEDMQGVTGTDEIVLPANYEFVQYRKGSKKYDEALRILQQSRPRREN